jgi:hypothetical protein
MSLPPTFIEADALAIARDFIARAMEGDFINLGCSALHPDAGRRLVRRLMGHYALSSSNAMLTVVELAEQWDDAHIAVCELIHEFHNSGERLPAYLATYNDRIIAGYVPAKPRGRKKASNLLQNFIFAYLIVLLQNRCGLLPTRSPAAKQLKPCGCSVAAQVAAEAGLYRGDYEAMKKIWQQFKPIAERIGMAEIVGN